MVVLRPLLLPAARGDLATAGAAAPASAAAPAIAPCHRRNLRRDQRGPAALGPHRPVAVRLGAQVGRVVVQAEEIAGALEGLPLVAGEAGEAGADAVAHDRGVVAL